MARQLVGSFSSHASAVLPPPPPALQDFHPGVLMRLKHDTAQHRNAFLDLAFLRKQRQKDGSSTSRQWYVGVDAWIVGTLAASEAAPAFFDDEVSCLGGPRHAGGSPVEQPRSNICSSTLCARHHLPCLARLPQPVTRSSAPPHGRHAPLTHAR